MKFALLTFGCRVNQADSLAIEASLRARGAEPSAPGQADVLVVNSCSVTATADQATRQAIRRVARANPSVRVIVTGCYATRKPADVSALPAVVRVLSNDCKDDVADAACAVGQADSHEGMTSADRFAGLDGPCGAPEATLAPGALGRTAFTLRVQTGCDAPCSYCIIPSTRGRSRSTPPDALVREVRRIEAAGYREVTLTGVHLGAYGSDLRPPVPLPGLLRQLLDATEALVFRLGSLEPMDCTPALVDLTVSSARLAPALHLPLQHASDRVLGAMRRGYTGADYAGVARHVRDRLPHASIGTDVIVGFPGETEEDVDILAAYLASSPITQVHVFPYSDRPGTEASRLEPKIHGAVIRERSRRVRAIGGDLSSAFVASQLGAVHRALTTHDGSMAVTINGLRVVLSEPRARNEWVDVRLEDRAGTLYATPAAGAAPSGGTTSWGGAEVPPLRTIQVGT
jgi:threonylcarbamoyladenosine tRNA methylthiotransferase MtaB